MRSAVISIFYGYAKCHGNGVGKSDIEEACDLLSEQCCNVHKMIIIVGIVHVAETNRQKAV